MTYIATNEGWLFLVVVIALFSRQARDEAIAWLFLCNSARMHATLAYARPIQFEQTWLSAQPMQANS